ncbi:MAG: hypothetical protein KKE02_14275 [Alphaproteobacteria bacterium]|nr:hypothetical protein [Alphaproteobacteria bacterium]MBU1513158.1 hypothetical protein [Alphaproteobacteria bacterium]MBU2095266.1 hypothetical protein [Alphaproteobacteria bacterium]MBU2152181.1 hypothetical protein [Alphaproteobacteria bacterium]MBU2306772.1 hypothetical protein [Alphaproteobacteria bacterium]
MRRAAAVLTAASAALVLAGCQTLRPVKPTPVAPQPAPAPVIVVPKPPPPPPPPPPPAAPKSCVPKGLSAAPRYPDSDAALRAAPGAADRYQLLAAGRILRQERLDDLERVITACR